MPRGSTAAQRAILHLDMDTFFVSVERLKDPRLVGRPVVVGGSPTGRGVVASASYEARLYGIHSAMPMTEAVRRCRALVIVPGAFHDYLVASRQVRAILERTIPLVEPASIDEFYGDLTGTARLHGTPETHFQRVLTAIRAETGLPCSGALATNKLVAKVATQWAKPNGARVVPHGHEAATFAPLPVSALPGIGPVTQVKLERHHIATLGELSHLDPVRLNALFGRHGVSMVARARGEDDSPVIPASDAKSLGHEITFPRDLTRTETLATILWELAAQVGYQLRQEQLTARTITLKLRRGDFSTLTRSTTLPRPTNRDYDLAQVAEEMLSRVHREGSPVRLLGLRVTQLLTDCEQRLLFEAASQEEERTYYATLDAIRDRFGFGAISRARTLTTEHQPKDDRTTEGDSLFALSSRQAVARIVKREEGKRVEGKREGRAPGTQQPEPVRAAG